MVALIVLGSIFLYAFIGGVAGARHHYISRSKCSYGVNCWKTAWCGHCYISVYVMGALWPLGLPAWAGMMMGSTTKISRDKTRRERELAEAKHQSELARLRRMENEELDRQLGRV